MACRKKHAELRKIPAECPQCKGIKVLLGKKRICQSCTHRNYYILNREKVIKKTGEYQRVKIREKRGLSLDHPRLIGEFGDGYLSKRDGYRYLNKIGHPNASDKNDEKFRARISEHRFVMSEHLGRPLKKGESVHHKNSIRHDNRIENLELWHKGQPNGGRLQDKIDWAIEFLKEYGYEVS